MVWLLLAATVWSPPVDAQSAEAAQPMDLKAAVSAAIEANIRLRQATQDIDAAEANRKVQRSNLLATFNATYRYTRNDEAVTVGPVGFGVEDEYEFRASFRQPLFTGGALIDQYRISELGLDAANLNEQVTRLDVIFLTKQAYFNVLKAAKLVEVAQNTVKLVEAQVEVARNFYEVGMRPLNDLLQVQVELANAKQELITAENQLDVAQSSFNIILRRPVNAPVVLVDIEDYLPLENDLEYYLALADRNREELKISNLEIQIAEKQVQIARSTYYPDLSLEGAYFKLSSQWDLSEGDAFFDNEGWSISGVASWDFWEWGRTKYNVSEKESRLEQVRLDKENIYDQIRVEVERAYLKAIETEKNILAVETAIEQARENMRITDERFKEQVATSTELLVAQNLLTRTQTNYFNALYDFKIAKAFLEKAVSLEILE
jgi:outer membrane protein TolC